VYLLFNKKRHHHHHHHHQALQADLVRLVPGLNAEKFKWCVPPGHARPKHKTEMGDSSSLYFFVRDRSWRAHRMEAADFFWCQPRGSDLELGPQLEVTRGRMQTNRTQSIEQ